MPPSSTGAARKVTPLKRILDEEGRRQSWLAAQVGATRDQVNRWVQGVHVPVDDTKIRIAQALGRDVTVVFPSEVNLDEAA